MLGLFTNIFIERASLIHRLKPLHSHGLAFPSPFLILDDIVDNWKLAISRTINAARSSNVFNPLRVPSWTFSSAFEAFRAMHISIGSHSESHLSTSNESTIAHEDKTSSQSPIVKLLNNPALRDPSRAPRFPIVLCHGLYGFDVSRIVNLKFCSSDLN